MILGDGHISAFPRTDSLRIVGNADNKGFIRRYTTLVKKVFGKEPAVAKVKGSRATTITIYEKYISERLTIPTGSRKDIRVSVPLWILRDRRLIIRYLRGLYEAEGSFNIHLPTYTHKFLFSNKNKSLLRIVAQLVQQLGFHPHISSY